MFTGNNVFLRHEYLMMR